MLVTTLLKEASALNASGMVNLRGQRAARVYVAFSGNPSAGAVVIETAHSKDWSGDWAQLQSISAAAGIQTVTISDPILWVRARITTALTGGTVTVVVCAWGG